MHRVADEWSWRCNGTIFIAVPAEDFFFIGIARAEPLVCAMYVDKRLSGIQTVQTLSRFNRTTRGKEATVSTCKHSGVFVHI